MQTKSNETSKAPSASLRYESGPGWTLSDVAQAAILASGLILTPAALFSLSEEAGALAAIKNLAVGVMAAGGAYAVVRLSLTSLAKFHALNHRAAGFAAVTGIALAGGALALSSFTGLTYNSVEARTYAMGGQELAEFIDKANDTALIAARVTPSIEALGANIAATIDCEISESCLSGSPATGRGPMTRELDAFYGTAATLSEQLEVGEAERAQHLNALNDLSTDYFDVLADQSKPIASRRSELQAIFGEVKQTTSALLEATPMHLVVAFADELQKGATISGDPNGSRKLSAYLRDLGRGLEAQLDALPEAEHTAPTMPDRPGMVDVVKFVPAYLAFAVVVVIGDLLLPLLLYTMTYLVRLREVEIMYGKRPADEPPHPFAGIVAPEYLPARKGRGNEQ